MWQGMACSMVCSRATNPEILQGTAESGAAHTTLQGIGASWAVQGRQTCLALFILVFLLV